MIDTGIFPSILKNAKVSPIYKTGARCLTTNYRPISVLPTLSKLIEKHISSHLYRFLSKYKLLHSAQSGFRHGHSCQTALINLVDSWMKEIDNGNLNLAVMLDLRKAFDVIDHEILCQKLHLYGCSERSMLLFRSYLSNRTQEVQIGNATSTKLEIRYGVPQGSILGPLMFILFINDLPLHILNCKTDMYADDSTIHRSGKCIKELGTIVQEDLDNVERWCETNNMYINCSKTKYMIIGTRQRIENQNCQLSLMINSEMIEKSTNEKLLGVKIDPCLKWSMQVDQLCSKVSSRIYLLSRIKQYLNLESRKLFYTGYILPLIDYCCIIWGSCSKYDTERILKLQKRAIRLILDADPLSPSDPLFKSLQWMKIDQRIKYHKYMLLYKCLSGDAPSYLTDNFEYLSNTNPYPLRNVENKNLYIPKAKTEIYKKSFTYSGTVLWNALPQDIRNSKSIGIFRERIKDHILSA